MSLIQHLRTHGPTEKALKEHSKVRKVAFVADYLPRKCGIATFTSDLLTAVATAYPQSHCLSVSVNDLKSGYEYPEVVRFEQSLPEARQRTLLNQHDGRGI